MSCANCPVRDGVPCAGLADPRICEWLAAGSFSPWQVEQHSRNAAGIKAPGLVQMAANLAGAVIGHVADGMRKAPPEVQAEREATCRACPHWDGDRCRCKICGCVYMATKWAMASEACPDTPPRWNAV